MYCKAEKKLIKKSTPLGSSTLSEKICSVGQKTTEVILSKLYFCEFDTIF